ncbi:FAD:protein FMN transferase [Flavihumibacter fluvii]|uniref:FAD:protein FMN transferase n=1 Tax=Flavihumibacter fluvii TaxID=2838157 RepID=UPI001BDEEC80|nr:FAD:protein FMN transferase [Flavihumibacter fluvii]ULQ54184.1 FAD:protein FMN transferase [Flavihumibacter fluvii]
MNPIFSAMFFRNQNRLKPIFCTILLALFHYNIYAQPKRYSYSRQKMGSPFNIILYAEDSTSAATIANNCYNLTDSLVNIFSDYIDSSELNRLCANAGNFHQPFAASPALFDILSLSKSAYEYSKGSFDITLGPITRMWRKARRENSWPSDQEVAENLSLTGFDKVYLDPKNHLVVLKKPGMKLDLGGIAQGYIAQKVINRIRNMGISIALVDVSGDITVIGSPPDSKGWTVGVNLPEQKELLMQKVLLIQNTSVTTSGDAYQFMLHDGKKYSHVVDPASGYGLTSRRNVTVIAKDCTTADWLAKACSILPLPQAKKLAKQLQAEFLIAELHNETLSIHQTRHFKEYWKAARY